MLGLTKRKKDNRRKKGLAGIALCLLPLLGLGVLPLRASPDIKVRVFGRELSFDAGPVMENGRIMVPVRKIGDALQTEVTYDSANRTITMEKGSYTVTLPLDSKSATKVVAPEKTGDAYKTKILNLDVPAKMSGGRVLVPICLLAEGFDLEIYWNARTSAVNVGMYLEDVKAQPGWQILRGHPLENDIEILVKAPAAGSAGGGEPEFLFRDLMHDRQEQIRWHNGQIWQTQTREEIYRLLDNQSYLLGPERCGAYFGQIYEDWLDWEYKLNDAEEMYNRYLDCLDLGRYGLSGKFGDIDQVSVSGAMEHKQRPEFAYIGQTWDQARAAFGEPAALQREKEGAAGSGEVLQYSYGEFSLLFSQNKLAGFRIDGGGWGTAGVFIGDQREKILEKLGLPKGASEIDARYSGQNVLELYFRENGVTHRFDRIAKEEAAGKPYFVLRFFLDDDAKAEAISFMKVD